MPCLFMRILIFPLLNEPEEKTLIKLLVRYPETIYGAARSLEPHRLTFYLNELAGIFHSYYNKNKVISDNERLTAARLFSDKGNQNCLAKCFENFRCERAGKDVVTNENIKAISKRSRTIRSEA